MGLKPSKQVREIIFSEGGAISGQMVFEIPSELERQIGASTLRRFIENLGTWIGF